MQSLRDINEYLFYEFGFDLEEDESRISDDWPFALQPVGEFHSAFGERQVYQFTCEGETHYVLTGQLLTYCPAEGLSLEDLRRAEIGGAWIAEGCPIDLSTSQIGDEAVPSLPTRRAAIQELAFAATGGREDVKILEGLFLRRRGSYLAVVEIAETGDRLIIGTELRARKAPHPRVAPHRQLALGIGSMIEARELEGHG